MENGNLMVQMKDCAIFLYQNNEQSAYEKLNELLPKLSEILKQQGDAEQMDYELVTGLIRLFEVVQRRDHLAIADLLYDVIPGALERSDYEYS